MQIPQLLIGLKVQVSGRTGTILEVGHRYGPGEAFSQALVRWVYKSRRNKRPQLGPVEVDCQSWHYIESLFPDE